MGNSQNTFKPDCKTWHWRPLSQGGSRVFRLICPPGLDWPAFGVEQHVKIQEKDKIHCWWKKMCRANSSEQNIWLLYNYHFGAPLVGPNNQITPRHMHHRGRAFAKIARNFSLNYGRKFPLLLTNNKKIDRKSQNLMVVGFRNTGSTRKKIRGKFIHTFLEMFSLFSLPDNPPPPVGGGV